MSPNNDTVNELVCEKLVHSGLVSQHVKTTDCEGDKDFSLIYVSLMAETRAQKKK